jgi:pullulanase
MTSAYDILSNLVPVHCDHPQVGAFRLTGDAAKENGTEMFIIFSAAKTAETVPLPCGKWQVVVNAEKAGTVALETVETQVTLSPISAMVLIKNP